MTTAHAISVFAQACMDSPYLESDRAAGLVVGLEAALREARAAGGKARTKGGKLLGYRFPDGSAITANCVEFLGVFPSEDADAPSTTAARISRHAASLGQSSLSDHDIDTEVTRLVSIMGGKACHLDGLLVGYRFPDHSALHVARWEVKSGGLFASELDEQKAEESIYSDLASALRDVNICIDNSTDEDGDMIVPADELAHHLASRRQIESDLARYADAGVRLAAREIERIRTNFAPGQNRAMDARCDDLVQRAMRLVK